MIPTKTNYFIIHFFTDDLTEKPCNNGLLENCSTIDTTVVSLCYLVFSQLENRF